MIALNLKINNEYKKVNIEENILFNAILSTNPKLIKKLIKTISPSYKINNTFFTIVNQYIEYTEEAKSIYCGLIVRTNAFEYAVLYLENYEVDEIRIMDLVKEFIYDTDDFKPTNITINKIEVDKRTFLATSRFI